jgi:HTH-type transcriptional regulator/antitoxin HipB
MQIRDARELGDFVREQRKAVGLSQGDLAARATVSRRWLSDLEAGKSTAEVGLVFKVISALGLYLDAHSTPDPEIDLDAFLDSMGDQP